jgi:hypothetical protein
MRRTPNVHTTVYAKTFIWWKKGKIDSPWIYRKKVPQYFGVIENFRLNLFPCAVNPPVDASTLLRGVVHPSLIRSSQAYKPQR